MKTKQHDQMNPLNQKNPQSPITLAKTEICEILFGLLLLLAAVACSQFQKVDDLVLIPIA